MSQHKAGCIASLHNIGNTCYINSILQVLYRTPGFVDFIAETATEVQLAVHLRDLSDDQDEETSKNLGWNLVTHLNKLFKRMQEVEALSRAGETVFTALRPYDLHDSIVAMNPMFGDYFQHDAHELLRCILTHIDDTAISLRQFCSNAMKDFRLHSSTSCPAASHSFPHDTLVSAISSSLSGSQLTRTTVRSCPPLVASVSESGLRRSARRRCQSTSRRCFCCSPQAAETGPLRPGNGPCQSESRLCRSESESHLSESGPCNSGSHDWHSLHGAVSGPRRSQRRPQTSTSRRCVCCSPQGTESGLCRSERRRCESARHSLQSAESGPHSALSLPRRHLVVDLCMPWRCKSLGALQCSSRQRLSSAVVVLPNLICDRLKRKRKSSPSSLIYSQQTPVNQKHFHFSDGCSNCVNGLGKHCKPATPGCFQDSFLSGCNKTYKLSANELLVYNSGDCCTQDRILMQSADNALLAQCNTLHGLTDKAVGVPVASAQCSLEALPQATGYASLSIGDQLLLHLHALESGRSCYVTLCCDDTNRFSSSAISYHGCTLKDRKTSMKKFGVRRRVACVRDMFGGQMLTKMKCLKCGYIGRHHEPYEDVALFTGHPVPSHKKQQHEWIFDALDEVEHLDGDNRYQCSACCELVAAERSICYVTSPAILTFHLKRFTADAQYELYGVVAHFGKLTSSGHYVAYIRGDPLPGVTSPTKLGGTYDVAINGLRLTHRQRSCQLSPVNAAMTARQKCIWYECDDAVVTTLTEEQFLAKLRNSKKFTPYLLFYTKCYR